MHVRCVIMSTCTSHNVRSPLCRCLSCSYSCCRCDPLNNPNKSTCFCMQVKYNKTNTSTYMRSAYIRGYWNNARYASAGKALRCRRAHAHRYAHTRTHMHALVQLLTGRPVCACMQHTMHADIAYQCTPSNACPNVGKEVKRRKGTCEEEVREHTMKMPSYRLTPFCGHFWKLVIARGGLSKSSDIKLLLSEHRCW